MSREWEKSALANLATICETALRAQFESYDLVELASEPGLDEHDRATHSLTFQLHSVPYCVTVRRLPKRGGSQ